MQEWFPVLLNTTHNKTTHTKSPGSSKPWLHSHPLFCTRSGIVCETQIKRNIYTYILLICYTGVNIHETSDWWFLWECAMDAFLDLRCFRVSSFSQFTHNIFDQLSSLDTTSCVFWVFRFFGGPLSIIITYSVCPVGLPRAAILAAAAPAGQPFAARLRRLPGGCCDGRRCCQRRREYGRWEWPPVFIVLVHFFCIYIFYYAFQYIWCI